MQMESVNYKGGNKMNNFIKNLFGLNKTKSGKKKKKPKRSKDQPGYLACPVVKAEVMRDNAKKEENSEKQHS